MPVFPRSTLTRWSLILLDAPRIIYESWILGQGPAMSRGGRKDSAESAKSGAGGALSPGALYEAGLHHLGRMAIYVSRGTGYWGPPKRIGAPSEISEIRLAVSV
jgi:hypothetical protein